MFSLAKRFCLSNYPISNRVGSCSLYQCQVSIKTAFMPSTTESIPATNHYILAIFNAAKKTNVVTKIRQLIYVSPSFYSLDKSQRKQIKFHLNGLIVDINFRLRRSSGNRIIFQSKFMMVIILYRTDFR